MLLLLEAGRLIRAPLNLSTALREDFPMLWSMPFKIRCDRRAQR